MDVIASADPTRPASPHAGAATRSVEADLGAHVHLGLGLLIPHPVAADPYLPRRERRRRGQALAAALSARGATSTVCSDLPTQVRRTPDDLGRPLPVAGRPGALPPLAAVGRVRSAGRDAVLHLHLDGMAELRALTACAAVHRGPVIVHVHGAPGRPLTTGDAATWRHRLLGRAGQRLLLDRADLVVVGGSELAEAVSAQGARRVTVIPPATLGAPSRPPDTPATAIRCGETRAGSEHRPTGTRAERRRVVSLGPLTAHRRPTALVRALDGLPDDVELTFLGGGAQRPALEQLARDRGVTTRVRVLPTASWATVLDHLLTADVVATTPLLSDDPEPLLLAMAAARPVLSTYVDRVRQVITDRVDGRLVDPVDDEALVAGLGELLDDPAGAAVLGASAQRRTAARDWDQVAGEVLSHLERR